MDEKTTISAAEIRGFSKALRFTSDAFAALAEWLESQEVQEMPGGGTPTAKKAIGYLGGFAATILKSYAVMQLGDDVIAGATPEIAAGLTRAEASLKTAAKPRSGRKHDPTQRGLTEQELADKHGDGGAVPPRKKREKKN